MRSSVSAAPALALAACALSACDRPRSLIVCHNANCAEPADPARDDTLGALRESLALEHDGRPAIDGVELDSFLRGADDTCIYAHDLENTQDSPPATAPAMVLAEHFERPGPISFTEGEPFQVFLELKSHVSASTDRHTPEQRVLHAQCAWQVYEIVAAAAVANDREVRVTISAFAPELLQAVLDQQPPLMPVPFRLGVVQGVPAPLDDQTRPLDDYRALPIGLFEFHAQWLLDAQYEAFASYRNARATPDAPIDLALFMFTATVETFDAVDRYEPQMIVTNEARLFRRWLER